MIILFMMSLYIQHGSSCDIPHDILACADETKKVKVGEGAFCKCHMSSSKFLWKFLTAAYKFVQKKLCFLLYLLKKTLENARKITYIYKVFLWNCFSFSLAFLEKLLMKVLALGQQILTMKKKLRGLIYKNFYNLKFGRKIFGVRGQNFQAIWGLAAHIEMTGVNRRKQSSAKFDGG